MNIARMIDHTLLRSDAREKEIEKLIEEAIQYQFASVCVNPTWVSYCAKKLAGIPVKVCTVIGFPLGATTSAVKIFETTDAIANGATEIDMVMNIGALKAGHDESVKQDIAAVVQESVDQAIVKVIIETCLLTDEEKIRACKVAVNAGAHFVKSSTGFAASGATRDDVALMRKIVGPHIGVKASGGVRSLKDVKFMISAGASRIGTSSSVEIINGQQATSSY